MGGEQSLGARDGPHSTLFLTMSRVYRFLPRNPSRGIEVVSVGSHTDVKAAGHQDSSLKEGPSRGGSLAL